jgi:sugar diacid utilization regulator
MLQITEQIAQQLVEFVSGETGYNMIVCDRNGVIIGDRSKERFGVRHDGAALIMRGEADSIAITKEEAARSGGRMREGYNIVIRVDGERIGTFGIAGQLEIVTPIAKIASAVIAARIKESRHLALISEVASEISRSVEQTAAAIENIYAGSEELNAANRDVTRAVTATEAKIQDTSQLLDFILDVSEMTSLLGLNAAIIAAQAGQHGRGFSVVADEIRKLGKNSSASVDKITEILGQIKSGIAEVSAISEKTAITSEQQFRATQQIARDIANIKKSVDTLAAMVQNGD